MGTARSAQPTATRAERAEPQIAMISPMSTLALLLPSSLPRRSAWAVLALALAGAAGCKDRSIAVYRVPRETLPAASAPESSPAVAANATPGIHWDAPAGWQSQKADGLRAGSFIVTGGDGATADVSIITFSGTGGDDLANVNRWRGQVQLPPITAAELSAQVRTIGTLAGPVSLVELTGTTGDAKAPSGLLGAWVRSSDRVWFFKLAGPAPLVAAQREPFMTFLKSVTLTAGTPAGPAPAPSAAPAAGAAMTVPPPPADAAPLRWTAPADWQAKAAGSMRKGSYSIGDAEVAITVFAGDVGGILANVNRWRGQAGLPPVDEAGLDAVTTQLTSHGLHFVATDAAGPAPAATRIVAVLVPWQGSTWFFKLTGPNEAVGRAKAAFLDFIQTVEAP